MINLLFSSNTCLIGSWFKLKKKKRAFLKKLNSTAKFTDWWRKWNLLIHEKNYFKKSHNIIIEKLRKWSEEHFWDFFLCNQSVPHVRLRLPVNKSTLRLVWFKRKICNSCCVNSTVLRFEFLGWLQANIWKIELNPNLLKITVPVSLLCSLQEMSNFIII